jgi:hypothetical protein
MPKNSTPKHSHAPKAFDVFKPGKSMASPTSRPVIARHRPPVQDSTLTNKPGKPVSNARTGEESTDPYEKVDITPSESTSGESAVPDTVPEPSAGAQEQTQPIEPNDQQEAKLPDESLPEPLSVAEPAIGEPASAPFEAATSVPDADIVAPEEDTVAATPIVDTSKVVVSHHKRSGRPVLKAFLVLFVLLVLAVAAFDVLLDAGVIDIGKNLPHTNLIGR